MGLTSWGLPPVQSGRLRVTSAFVLYRRRLRRRGWVPDLLAVLGIAAGVALLYATQVASTSLTGPIARLNEGIVGAGQLQLVARGAATIPAETYARIAALPGVTRAAPVLQVPGNLVGKRGEADVTLFGADPRLVRLRGSLLKGFTSTDAAQQETVVVPSTIARRIGLRFGDDVRVQLSGRTISVPAAVADRGQIGGLVDTSIALVPLSYLQRMSRQRGAVSRVLVEAERGKVAQVRGELRKLRVAGSDVRSSTYDTTLFKQATIPTSEASTIFAVLSALVGWMFAVCALLVTAADRRKLVVQQHRQGFPASATVKTLLVDAAVIGVVGAAVGLGVGEIISRAGFRSDVSFLSGAFPVGDVRIVSWRSVVVAVAGGGIAAVVGVLGPVREVLVATFRPGRRAAVRAAGRGPALAGLLCLAGAVAVTVALPRAAVTGVALLGLGVALLLPLALRTAVNALERINRRGRSSAALALALQQLRAPRWRARAVAIATICAVAVYGTSALQGARVNLQTGLDGLSHDLSGVAGVWVAAPGAGSAIGTSPFVPDDTGRLRAVPGVASVDLYRAGLLDVADQRAWVAGPPAQERVLVPSSQILTGSRARVDDRLRAGGWATVSRRVADALGLRLGQRFVLPTPRPIGLRLAAITTNLGWSAGAVVLSASDFARAWGSDAIAAYHLQLDDPRRADAVRDAAAAALGKASGLRAETAAQRMARQSAVARSGLSRLGQIIALTLMTAVLAMGAAMTGMLWQHRGAVAAYKYNGLATGLLWRGLMVEAGVLFAVGALTGALAGLLGQILATRGLASVTGFPVSHDLRPWTLVQTAGIVFAVSLLAVVVPGYRVARLLPSSRQ